MRVAWHLQDSAAQIRTKVFKNVHFWWFLLVFCVYYHGNTQTHAHYMHVYAHMRILCVYVRICIYICVYTPMRIYICSYVRISIQIYAFCTKNDAKSIPNQPRWPPRTPPWALLGGPAAPLKPFLHESKLPWPKSEKRYNQEKAFFHDFDKFIREYMHFTMRIRMSAS